MKFADFVLGTLDMVKDAAWREGFRAGRALERERNIVARVATHPAFVAQELAEFARFNGDGELEEPR